MADDDRHYSIDTSCTDKEYSIDNLKSTNKKNIDDGYKEENLQHQHCNASVINKTKEEEVLIKKLMSVNFQKKVIHYVICTVTSCSKKERIGKKNKERNQIYMGNTPCYSIIAIDRGKLLSTYIVYVQKNGTSLFKK